MINPQHLMNQEGGSNQPKNIVMYLIRSLNKDTLDETGREFHMKPYRSVRSGVQRMGATVKKGRKLEKGIETLRAQVHVSQEVPPLHSRRARR